MKLAVLPQTDTRTSLKLTVLILIQAFIPMIAYRFVFQVDMQPSGPAYLCAMFGLGYAAHRITAMPYWQNLLLTAIPTFAAVCLFAATDIYW